MQKQEYEFYFITILIELLLFCVFVKCAVHYNFPLYNLGGPPPNAQSQAAPSSQQPSSSAWGNQSRGPPPGGNNQGL